MNKLQALNRKLANATQQFDVLRNSIQEQQVLLTRRQVVNCSHCNEGSQLKGWCLMQFGGMSTTHALMCPRCGEWITVYGHRQKNNILFLVDKKASIRKSFLIKYFFGRAVTCP
ncbi:MAG TPA: hypothetical protein DDX26_03045 [Candidatus Yonathbacteria bacterium]|nr:hypothetical protein [Candidatus Yonathbacteria bacterium]